MNTTQLLALGTIIKSIICLAGIIITIMLAVSGLSTKNNEKLKKAALVFFGMVGVIVALGLLEFLFLIQ
jgi:hypothetical protein